MRSVLTRLVFYRILYNEPILHRDCLYRLSRISQPSSKQLVRCSQRRTLFGFSRPTPPPIKETDSNPGLDILINASKNLETRTRVPEPDELLRAWAAFFKARNQRKELVNDLQAAYAFQVYRHLKTIEQPLPLIALDDAFCALTCKQIEDGTLHEGYVTFVNEIYADILPRTTAYPERLQIGLIRALCSSGNLRDALDLTKRDGLLNAKELRIITRAATSAGDAEALEQLLSRVDEIEENKQSYALFRLAVAFASLGNMQKAKAACDSLLQDPAKSSESEWPPESFEKLLRLCLQHNELEFGRALIRAFTEAGYLSRSRRVWTALFVWTLGTGKSVDEVDRMIEVMVRTNADLVPNQWTINSLLSFANSRNDPYLAERILALGRKWKVEPDARTFMLQMDYRLSVGDLEGARAAYRQLQAQEIQNDNDLPRINKLIQTMCESGKYEFSAIMGVVDDLSRRQKGFEAATVAALSVLHLKRDEYHDVADLLTTHVPQYSAEDRAMVRGTFFKFCFDRRNSIARVWDTYMIFQQVFDEADRDMRTRIMNEFITRRRSDMAVHVFNHMRKHTRDDTVPTTDTYAAALTGIGKLKDMESMIIVHNAIRLDMNIEPSTKLSNALMLSYTGCNEARYAINFWMDICNSLEGPNHNSIMLLFHACQHASFGEKRAMSVWNQLSALDVEMTRDVVAMYLAALAGNGCFDEAKAVVEECEEKYGFGPDAVMLGLMFNATGSQSKQLELADWMKEKYPAVWTELEGVGSKTTKQQTKQFKVKIELEP